MKWHYYFFIVVFSLLKTTHASMVYVPENFNSKTARVLVVIHGCLQSAETMATGTGWNSIADKENLVVIYPQVPTNSNPLDCWSWYLPKNQTPKMGQLALIKKEISFFIRTLNIKKSKIFVTGISSGGGMAAGLLACYPNFFTAGAIHSAPPYGLASNLEEGHKLLQSAKSTAKTLNHACKPSEFSGKLLVIQGNKDLVVNPKNADLLITQFTGNPKRIKTTEKEKKDSLEIINYKQKGHLKARLIKIANLGHAWSGFSKNLKNSQQVGPKSKPPTILPFFTANGPSSTDLIWAFFNE